jgi:hypothetical protein
MHRYLLALLLLLAGTGAWSQEDASEDEPQAAQETAEAASDEEQDDLDIDEENYLDAEEEDFVPTEDIPADQAIAFPTDI